jgi:hypothetical protein
MRIKSSPSSSLLVSRTLKTVGVVVILATLLDLAIGAIPYNILDRAWQIAFTTQLVDRGIVPMVGIVLFLTGCWVDSNSSDSPAERKSLFLEPKVWAFILASILGAIYLLAFPLHLSNVGWSNQQRLEQISQKAKEAEAQFGNQLSSEITSQQAQITQLLNASDDQLKQLVDGQQLSSEQAELIRKFKADPKAIEPFLKQRSEELKTQIQTRIGTEKTQAEKAAQTESLKSGLRIGISSLLLAAGFIIIGWTGLRTLGQY